MAAKNNSKSTLGSRIKSKSIDAFNQASAAAKSPAVRDYARTAGAAATGTLLALGALELARTIRDAVAA